MYAAAAEALCNVLMCKKRSLPHVDGGGIGPQAPGPRSAGPTRNSVDPFPRRWRWLQRAFASH